MRAVVAILFTTVNLIYIQFKKQKHITQKWISHLLHDTILGTCESAICVRIEYRLESSIKIRIKYFQIQRRLITKISNYKLSKRRYVELYIPHDNPQTH